MIYFISGGARSGKSNYASQLALELSNKPIYVATAKIWDEDFKKRVDRHLEERGKQWTTIEEHREIGKLDLKGKVAVIDCVTLWLTNFFVETEQDIDKCLEQAKKEVDRLVEKDATLIIISNEIGMGVHANSEAGRKFTDLQGWVNQYIAEKADKVIFMESGLPLTIKE